MSHLPSRTRFAALLLALVTASASPAAAQVAETVLSPAGRLRIEVSPSFHLWNRRFGESGSEPLARDLEEAPLLPVADLESVLRTALGDPSFRVTLGSARASLARERARVDLGLALGATRWLTLGANVPIVDARSEVAFDFRAVDGTNVGSNPFFFGNGTAAAFIGTLDASRSALQQRVSQSCPNGAQGGGSCGDLVDLLGRYTAFAGGLATAYGASPVFVTTGSPAGAAIQQRMNAFRAEIGQKTPGVPTPTGSVPLAAKPLDETGLRQALADPGAGLFLAGPLQNSATDWRMGDVEVTAAIRAVDGALRDSAGGPVRFRYQLGGQLLVRLPTGQIDLPDVPLDLGTGDGQLDLQSSVFVDLAWRRPALHAEGAYGVQSPTNVLRRVAPPEMPMAPFFTRVETRWTPGRYLQLSATPRWHFTEAFAVGALYRYWHKDADRYELLQGVPSPFTAADLERETEETLHEVGAGLVFSTVDAWEEGRAGFPFEARMAVRKAVAGAGGMTPDGIRMEASARLFWRLWGER